jgi:hypothetical protein
LLICEVDQLGVSFDASPLEVAVVEASSPPRFERDPPRADPLPPCRTACNLPPAETGTCFGCLCGPAPGMMISRIPSW